MKKTTSLFLTVAAVLALTPLVARADDDLDPSKLPPASTKTTRTLNTSPKA